MDTYKKTIKLRALALVLAAIAAAAILIFGVVTGKMTPHNDFASGGGFSFSNYFAGFQAGGLGAATAVFCGLAVKQLLALRSEDALKRRYVREHDERNLLISRASGGVLLHACAIVMLLATMAAGYYNQYVFFSLLGCTVFLQLVKMGAKAYYSRKY